MVTKSIKLGQTVRPLQCASCKIPCRPNAHHLDYGKPLEVLWLCNSCHGDAHQKKSHLNPNNISQTPLAQAWNTKDMVTISFSIPIKQFIILKEKAKESKKKLSAILRENILKEYPVESSQLEFNFEEDINGKTSHECDKNIQSLHADESLLFQQKCTSISSEWAKRNNDMSGMEEFYRFSQGYGRNAPGLQFSRASG
jgi:hypothetical protein